MKQARKTTKGMKENHRLSWDDYFLRLAELVFSRATCDRLYVGAILVRDRMVISSGYNGSPRGTKHCDEAGHRMVNGHCVRAVRAEVNAVVQAVYHGISTNNSILYTHYFPCEHCVKVLINAGVKEIVYRKHYKNLDLPLARELLKQAGVKLKRYHQPLDG